MSPVDLAQLIKSFDLTTVFFVRELYGFAWSYYLQRVKMGIGAFFEFNSEDDILCLFMNGWEEVLTAQKKGMPCKILNFDVHSQNLISTFFKEAGVSVSLEQLDKKRANFFYQPIAFSFRTYDLKKPLEEWQTASFS